MKNLKRVLSLGLASVMLLGMMVMGASAATFSDSDEIKNTEAVNLMVALNIIKGKDTGAFDPNGNVTRGEMAKMITMILFGGEEATLTTSSTPKFKDVTNHWARKYIEYCASESQGIIAGMGDGTFAPDAQVTGTAAAKMALVALGYNAKVYGFENNKDWDLNINTVANSKDANLYKGLKGLDPSQPITRDQAAQILFNALNAKIVEPSYTVTNNGIETAYTISKDTTMLMDRFDVVVYTATMQSAKWDKEEETYTYTFGNVKTKNDDKAATLTKFTFTEDVSDLFMQKVEIVTDDEGNILGIGASEDSGVLASGIVADLSVGKDANSNKLKVGKTHYSVKGDKPGDIQIFNVNTTTETTVSVKASLKDYWSVKVIDNDGDNKVDVIVTYPIYVEKVTSVSRTGISANGTYKFEDDTIEDGLKKDDYVVITKAANTAGKAVVEKAEITNGKIRSIKTVDGVDQVQIDSTWYKVDAGAKLPSDARGNTYDMVVVNGYVVKAQKAASNTTADIADTVLVVAADDPITGNKIGTGTQKVQLLFTDGTKKIVTVAKMNKLPGADNDYPLDTVSDTNKAEVDDLLTYSVNKDGDYELSTIVAKDFDDKATITSGSSTNFDSGKITTDDKGTVRVADDAVIFVKAENGDTYKVLTGADVNDWEKTTFANAELYANKDAGFLYTAMGLIDLGTAKIPGLAGDTKYGVVVGAAYRSTDEDGKKVTALTIWNGSENIEVFTRQSVTASDFAAGTIVSYTTGSGDEISKLTAITEGTTAKDNFVLGAVKAYAGGDEIEIWNDAKVTKLDKDVIILGINKDKNDYEGIEGAEIRLADQAEKDGALVADTWNCNVKYIFTETNEKRTIDVIVVETNNDFGSTIKVNGSAPVEPETPAPAEKVTIGAITAPVSKDGAAYEVKAGAGEVTVGEEFTVTIGCTTAPTNTTDGEVVTITYSGTEKTLTFKAVEEQSVKFTAVKDATSVTAEVK